MKAFAAEDIRGLMEYAPDALAASLAPALSLANRKLLGLFDLASLKLAIVIFSSLGPAGGGSLAAHHRDVLWQAFGLPVFEQLRGWDGKIIARECEVHNGLHFDKGALVTEPNGIELTLAGRATGLAAVIVESQCECGMERPRLCQLIAAKIRAAAA